MDLQIWLLIVNDVAIGEVQTNSTTPPDSRTGWVNVTGQQSNYPTYTPQIPVPSSVDAWQGKVVLASTPSTVNSGNTLLQDAENWIATNGTAAISIAWNNAPVWLRTGVMIPTVASGIGLTSDQIDSLFIEAAAVQG